MEDDKLQFVGCVLLDDYGRVLLLHRAVPPATYWELPGGKVESDETPEQAALRILDGDVGIKIRLVKALGNAELEDDERQYHFTWFQAAATAADPQLDGNQMYDDLDYVEIEDFMSLALADDLLVLLDKIIAGEVTFDR